MSFINLVNIYKIVYSERQKYGINSLKLNKIFSKKIFAQVNFSL
jgi:hypothetical protein